MTIFSIIFRYACAYWEIIWVYSSVTPVTSFLSVCRWTNVMLTKLFINCLELNERRCIRSISSHVKIWIHHFFLIIIYIINVSTERLKWRPMLRQMWESKLRQTLHVCVDSDTKIFSFLIGPNDVVRYDVTKFPAFCWT